VKKLCSLLLVLAVGVCAQDFSEPFDPFEEDELKEQRRRTPVKFEPVEVEAEADEEAEPDADDSTVSGEFILLDINRQVLGPYMLPEEAETPSDMGDFGRVWLDADELTFDIRWKRILWRDGPFPAVSGTRLKLRDKYYTFYTGSDLGKFEKEIARAIEREAALAYLKARQIEATQSAAEKNLGLDFGPPDGGAGMQPGGGQKPGGMRPQGGQGMQRPGGGQRPGGAGKAQQRGGALDRQRKTLDVYDELR
jgi:hypothetical protein